MRKNMKNIKKLSQLKLYTYKFGVNINEVKFFNQINSNFKSIFLAIQRIGLQAKGILTEIEV